MNKEILKQYQQDAARTCPDLGSIEDNTVHMVAGMITEYGELLDIYKKNFAYKKEVDKVNEEEEWADFMWYMANMFRMYGHNMMLHTFSELNERWINEIISDLEGYTNIELVIRFNEELSGITNESGVITDILHYWIAIGSILQINMEKALHNNIEKLKKRFPDKFDEFKALNRNLEDERKELEK